MRGCAADGTTLAVFSDVQTLDLESAQQMAMPGNKPSKLPRLRTARHPWWSHAGIRLLLCLDLAWLCGATVAGAERINHEGRILGPLPTLTNAVLFNTPEADAMLSALQIFPPDNAWNEDISHRPLLTNSQAMIAQIVAELSSSRRTLRAFYEMNFALVPANQPLAPIDLFNWPEESDLGPYPIPTSLPIEGWPLETGALTLQQWQADTNNVGGDRHAIIVQPASGWVWETWLTKKVGTNWEASNGARFNLTNNTLRPAGWTSGDAAGLCMFAGLVRFDECDRGMVEHAIRLVVKHTRLQHIYPATHYASSPTTTDPNVPAMGQRLRLKAGFTIPDSWSKHEKAVLRALKKYGAIVADNGGFFSISVAPDQRFPANAFDHLSSISVTNFEVIETTGPTGGPRSTGAPLAQAGSDRTCGPGQPLPLAGTITASSPVQIQWKQYSGPGTVVFANPAQTNATATFDLPGSYTLMLSADDGLHAVAYATMRVTVAQVIGVHGSLSNGHLVLSWTGNTGACVLERTDRLPATAWQPVTTTNGTSATVPVSDAAVFFRVRQP
jgi:hypothetical protein